MATVFIVSTGGQMDGDYEIRGVYTSAELASAAEAALEARMLTPSVEAFELDKLPAD